MKQQLINKLTDKSAIIGIVGLGYVGIPSAIRYAEVGYKVLGFDIDPEKIEKISNGKTYIKHLPDEMIQSAVNSGFEATTDFPGLPRQTP
jgi:UDP-N-acetyl-D-glucosamine dehydrogenase